MSVVLLILPAIMIEFILNEEYIKTNLPTGSILLDFIRQNKHLKGTKIGCREGDCGACTVLIGALDSINKVDYQAVVSCLTPIANVHGKHVVTIEGLNLVDGLTPVQNAIRENNATQCGYCTPGFVVSMTGYTFNKNTSISGIKEAVSGNICRCTGYKSIEKSTEAVMEIIADKDRSNIAEWLIDHHFIPDYFTDIPERLQAILGYNNNTNGDVIVGGGTDLYVKHAHKLHDANIRLLPDNVGVDNIKINGNNCTINVGATASNILEFTELHNYFPKLNNYFKLISSKQIRNMGTLAGNFVNASPIADLSIFFMALNSKIVIADENKVCRTIFLKDFFKDYKVVDLTENEIIKELDFELPGSNTYFNFEKVSKRTHLDIASVNTAMSITLHNNIINSINISAGGVAPIPLFLRNTCNFLTGKKLTVENIKKAHCVLKEEISPISDIRGSKAYKQLLIRQLYYSHFITLFPKVISVADISRG